MDAIGFADEQTRALQVIADRGGQVGARAVEYILGKQTRVIEDPWMSSRTGAQWRVDGNIYLPKGSLLSLNSLAGIVHEAKHLEQGSVLARSVLGELGGWQAEFGFRETYSGEKYPSDSPLGRLLALPVVEIAERRDAASLRAARADMLAEFPNYTLIYLYPLFPSQAFAKIVDWLSPRVFDPLQHAITRREKEK